MISVFAVSSDAGDEIDLAGDLRAAGVEVVGRSTSRTFVPEVIRSAADVLVCYEKHPDDALFTNLRLLAASSPRPVVLFTTNPDATWIEQASEAGIQSYVVDGYARQRLRAVIHVAQARFRHEQKLRAELTEITARYDERKLVDRAKGILMRARQISEDEAYSVLRTTAMQSKQRLGQVARHVIYSAHYSDAVNRAGQLRMLSQRLVKLYALKSASPSPDGVADQLAAATAHIDENIATLRRGLSKPTFGDLIDSVASPWQRLKKALAAPASAAHLPGIDAMAEALLENAERLTANLETAGLASKLRVVNVAGRQRMLAQRMAKLALLSVCVADPALRPPPAAMTEARAAFAESLVYLKSVPLSTSEIRGELDRAATLWEGFEAALADAASAEGRASLSNISDALVEKFDRLADGYERGLQMLLE